MSHRLAARLATPVDPDRPRRRVPSLAAVLVGGLAGGLVLGADAQAQTWDTWANHPGDQRYVRLDYPVVFVATEGHADPVTQTAPHFGLDVISAGNPAPHGPDGGLWVLLPDGRVEKLFPLPEHEAVPGLIDTPLGALEQGAVVEPNVSEDGRVVYFAYFHDQTWRPNGGGWQKSQLSYKGGDLYRLDLGPLLDDPGTPPAGLPVQRLTTKEYTGPAKEDVFQTDASKLAHAINPSTQGGMGYWGSVDMHAVELRTAEGLKLVWVSNRSRAANSNTWFSDPNHNFNLHVASLAPDGTLGPARQWQYYTTTSALSPTPMRNGLSFSYQSSTHEPRNWDIQWLDSEGRWKPLLGYGHGPRLFHLGTLVVDDRGRDWFVGAKYYNLNDGGFGQLHRTPAQLAGTNVFRAAPNGTLPLQVSKLITTGVIAKDEPSPQVLVNGALEYVGKFSSPRAGRVGGEYLTSYTPTSANRWLVDPDGKTGVFEAYLAYRPDLDEFEPHEPIDVTAGRGLYTVIAERSRRLDLVWPTPLLTWEERTGDARQRTSAPIRDPRTPIAPGMPYAQVGTSALWNTDVRPYDCYLDGTGTTPFSPNAISSPAKVEITDAVEGLRFVQDPGDFCRYLDPESVFGIAVHMTSNRIDLVAHAEVQYTTDGLDALANRKEAVELLGVYSPLYENIADQSFLARIPADTPFDFHLLDARYGMKLVDVRSWHSLKPRETRTDCGGCHQHEVGFGIDFEGTEASTKPALDLTGQTTYVAYDADCKPMLRRTSTSTLTTPEWKSDIWPGFAKHCSGCHDSSRSRDAAALMAYDYADEESARTTMLERNYANSTLGALGSPVFWAAYGERTDGRDNDLPAYLPDYASGVWGYRFSDVHATDPGLCAQGDQVRAEWVRTLGEWIDNHLPRDQDGTRFPYKYDRYHPAVDFALISPGAHAGLQPNGGMHLRIGFWDNSNQVDLEVRVDGQRVWRTRGQPNGAVTNALPMLPLEARIEVVASDPSGNRQLKEKSVLELLREAGGPRGAAR